MVGVFNKDSKLGDTQFDYRQSMRETGDASHDALIQQRHGGGGIDEIRQGYSHPLAQSLIERHQRSELKGRVGYCLGRRMYK